jgi:hypothetical protein
MYEWSSHTRNPRFLELDHEVGAVVDTKLIAGKGYLWQAGKRYGYQPTIEEAKAMAEGIADQLSLPRAQRWLNV